MHRSERPLVSPDAADSTGESLTIVDVCGVVYDRECWRAYLLAFAANAPNYLRVFGRRLCEEAGVELRRYRKTLADGPVAAVELLVDSGGLDVDIDRHVAELRAEGVVRQVLHGGMWKVSGGTVNDRMAALIDGHDELEFWAGLSLRDPAIADLELRRAHRDLGASGLSIVPFLDGIDVLGPEFEPLFSYAEREGLPVWLHCGQSFATNMPIDSCNWWHLDRLASRYPELVTIAGHGGWPWMHEMAAVAQRHRNVYLDVSTHRAVAMKDPGYGWEPILCRSDGALRRKLLFGSTTWVSGLSVGHLAQEFAGLELPDSTMRAWMSGNAARLLGS